MSAGATTTRHACGGTLLFVRLADGHSYERCSGCEFQYDFDHGRVSDASSLSFPQFMRVAVPA